MSASGRSRNPYVFVLLGLFALVAAYVILAAIFVTLAAPACGCAATPIAS